jgi:hypothetical protein
MIVTAARYCPTSIRIICCGLSAFSVKLGIFWARRNYTWLECPLIVYTDLNGFIGNITEEPPYQKRRRERFIVH